VAIGCHGPVLAVTAFTVGATQISDGEKEFRIEDRWVQASDTAWRVDRTLTVIAASSACGVRLLLDIVPAFAASRYEDLHYFALSALYDLNDLNRDGVEDTEILSHGHSRGKGLLTPRKSCWPNSNLAMTSPRPISIFGRAKERTSRRREVSNLALSICGIPKRLSGGNVPRS